ncbi:MAG: hypothetical protein ACQERU_05360 [Bacteroidota bacterium]
MDNQVINIVFYLPFEKENLNDEDRLWLLNFQTVLNASLEQLVPNKIKFHNPYTDQQELDFNEIKSSVHTIILEAILNPNFTREKLIQNQYSNIETKTIQLICSPLSTKIEEFDKIIAFNLFDENKAEKINLSVGLDSIKDEIWLKVIDISYEIKKHFASSVQTKSKGTIFLAQTSADQKSERETIKREFKHLGYKILPEKPFPVNLSDFERFVKEHIEKSTLSVHLIGNTYEPVLKGSEKSNIEIQNNIFSEIINNSKDSDLLRLVWIPQNFKPKSEQQRLYVESFKHNIELLKNTEIIQTPVEIFKSIIRKKAEEVFRVKQPEPVKSETINGSKKVYFIHSDFKGSEYSEIVDFFNQQNIEVFEMRWEKSKIDMIKEHQKNLVNSDAVLIYYASDNPHWLNSKLSDIKKSPGFGKKNDFLVKAILYKQETQPDIKIDSNDILMISRDKKDISSCLKPVTEKLK